MIPYMFDYRGDQVVHLLLGLIYPNFPPAPSPSTPATLDLGPKSKICSRDFFALSNAFQNDMTWRGSAKNHRGDRFQGKRPWCRPGATHPNIPQQQPSNPWLFHSIPSIHWKVIHVFLLHRWTHGWAHKLHVKQITPLPHFLPLTSDKVMQHMHGIISSKELHA